VAEGPISGVEYSSKGFSGDDGPASPALEVGGTAVVTGGGGGPLPEPAASSAGASVVDTLRPPGTFLGSGVEVKGGAKDSPPPWNAGGRPALGRADISINYMQIHNKGELRAILTILPHLMRYNCQLE
jgi:hypothetical protein